MPFQSEKQRRYLHANHPEIAKRWERDYANGGISNHFKLKDSGTPRRRYFTGAYGAGGTENKGSTGGNGGYQNVHQTGAVTQTPGRTTSSSGNGGYKNVHETGAVTQTPGRTTTRDNIENRKRTILAKLSTVQTLRKNVLSNKKTAYDELGIGDDLTDEEKEELENLEKESSIKSSLTMTAAEGGIARKNYYHGGILDINESEEIISDDGNDIELTAYNADFDDPNDLSTGVKSLFQAKDGGTPQLARKSNDGKRPGYGGPHETYGGGVEAGRGKGPSDRGPRDDPDRFGPTTETKTTTTKDDDAREQAILTRTYPKRYKSFDQPNPHLDKGFHTTQIRDYYDPRGYTKRAPKTEKESSLLDKIMWGIAIYTGLAPLMGLKVPGIVTTIGNVLGYKSEIDMALNLGKKLNLIGDDVTTDSLAESFVENFKNRTAKKEEYDSLPSGHPDKIALGIELQIGKTPDGDGGEQPKPPQIKPIGEEIQEYESIAPDAGVTLASRRSKQALQANLQAKWGAEKEAQEQEYRDYGLLPDNPIVMTANSGGLANLFRVKNH